MSALDDLLNKQYRDTLASIPEADEAVAELVARAAEPVESISQSVSQAVAAETETKVETEAKAEPDHTVNSEEAVVVGETGRDDHPEAELPETKLPQAEEKRPFKPEWEVDRFLWPVICEDMEARLETELCNAMETIVADCQQHESNVVAITKAGDGVGSTTMTLCLAREAARQGLTVAMIDLDHAMPSLMDRLGIACEHGIESLQKASVGTENICVTAVDDGVSLLPTLEAIDVDYCGSETVQQLINEVAEHHDLVLIDASPEAVDELAKGKFKQIGAILVADQADNEAKDIATRRYSNGEVRTLGLIENFAA